MIAGPLADPLFSNFIDWHLHLHVVVLEVEVDELD
jgi:hypothetical protein